MATKREQVYYELTATDGASRVFRQVEGSARSLGSAYTQVRSAVLLLASGGFVSSLVNAAKQGEQSQNRLTATLRATGDQIGITRRELDQMADTLAEATQFDDDSIRNAQGQLVKFGNIHGQVFRDALKVSADLAAFMGTDIPSAAQQVGRALQSPTEGITLLERHIGKLTEEQEKNIKSLAAQGRAVEAQNAVLKILQERVGGTAQLMNTGLTKATSDVAKAWDDMLEAWARGEAILPNLTHMLGGLRDVLNDIGGKSIQDSDPFRQFNVELQKSNEELTSLLRFRQRELAKGEAGAPTVAMLNQRIEAIRAEQRGTLARMRLMRSQMALEESLNPAPRQGELGGRVDQGAADRARREAEQVAAQESAALAAQEEILQEARDLGVKFLQEQQKKRDEAAKRAVEEMRRVTEAWVESAEVATEISEGMIYTWDAAGNRIQVTREAFEELEAAQRRAGEAGAELGFTFASAFEDAIVEGRKLRDVLDGLGKDIARIILRETVTRPMAEALSNWASGLFGGARADGGPVSAGRAYLVGERGAELFVPGQSGTIVPSGAGGVTINQTINAAAGVNRSELMFAMTVAKNQAKAEIEDAIARGSRRFLPSKW